MLGTRHQRFLLLLCLALTACKTTSMNRRGLKEGRPSSGAAGPQNSIDSSAVETIFEDPNLSVPPEMKAKTAEEAAAPVRDAALPKPVGLPFEAISAVGNYTCGVAQGTDKELTRKLYCWGSNDEGQFNSGIMGNNRFFPLKIADIDRIRALAQGPKFMCGLLPTGLACWGSNLNGQTTDPSVSSIAPHNLTAFKVAAPGLDATTGVAGAFHVCMAEMRWNNPNSSNNPDDFVPVSKISCWGGNFDGQVGIASSLAKVRYVEPQPIAWTQGRIYSLFAGDSHTCVLANANLKITSQELANRVYCWGGNAKGRLINTSDATEITAPTEIQGLTEPMLAGRSAGFLSCVLEQSGNLKCWGLDFMGRVSRVVPGTIPPAIPPTLVKLPFKVKAFAMNAETTCAINVNQELYCWGLDVFGLFGYGANSGKAATVETPVKVPLEGRVLDVALGVSHACALLEGGRVLCWGENGEGAIGSGLALPGIVKPTAVYQEL